MMISPSPAELHCSQTCRETTCKDAALKGGCDSTSFSKRPACEESPCPCPASSETASDISDREVIISTENIPGVPSWVKSLTSTSFYGPCEHHAGLKKNECTFFCMDCKGAGSRALCQYCLEDHTKQGHKAMQVRRYVYCDVVRSSDISEHMDISGIQVYIVNQANVVFLNDRPQTKPARGVTPDCCQTCNRQLRAGFRFCSLACKVNGVGAGQVSVQEPRMTAEEQLPQEHLSNMSKSNSRPERGSRPRASILEAPRKRWKDSAEPKPEGSSGDEAASMTLASFGSAAMVDSQLPGTPSFTSKPLRKEVFKPVASELRHMGSSLEDVKKLCGLDVLQLADLLQPTAVYQQQRQHQHQLSSKARLREEKLVSIQPAHFTTTPKRQRKQMKPSRSPMV